MISSPATSNAPKAEIPKIAPLFKGQKPEQRGGCKTYKSRNVNRCITETLRIYSDFVNAGIRSPVGILYRHSDSVTECGWKIHCVCPAGIV